VIKKLPCCMQQEHGVISLLFPCVIFFFFWHALFCLVCVVIGKSVTYGLVRWDWRGLRRNNSHYNRYEINPLNSLVEGINQTRPTRGGGSVADACISRGLAGCVC
jgi:hypothetical protein